MALYASGLQSKQTEEFMANFKKKTHSQPLNTSATEKVTNF
jgi:hypothetical protein